MKKGLLVFLIVISSTKNKSQVVFCPQGAEWNSLFSGSIFSPGNTYNETIHYTGDSISGTDTLKILSHNRFFITCGPYTNSTLIKQKGDTIFFKNKFSQNSWQILYNFAALTNHSWQTTLLINNGSQTKTFNYTVQTVGTVTINGLSLKQMTVTSSDWGGSGVITERLGSSAFLFHFSSKSPTKCEGDVFMESLCYKDNSFVLKQFGEKSCYYSTSNSVGLYAEANEMFGINISPNPARDKLKIEFTVFKQSDLKLKLVNSFGEVVYEAATISEKQEIDLSEFPTGIYFLRLQNLETQKVYKVIKS